MTAQRPLVLHEPSWSDLGWSELFVSQTITHMLTGGGFYWRTEGIRFSPASTLIGWSEQAGGYASTRWGARRKMRRYVKQWKAVKP